MRLVPPFLWILLKIYVIEEPSALAHEKIKPRIIGGKICSIEDFPFMVTVITSGLCGGTAISTEWILTAAHCVAPTMVKDRKPLIRAGFSSPQKDIQMRQSKKIIVHNKFDIDLLDSGKELRYDIALVLVDEPFARTKVFNPMELPKPGSSSRCKLGKVMGIGNERFYGSNPPTLKFEEVMKRPLKCVDLSIVDKTHCTGMVRNGGVLDSSLVMTMEPEGGKDACRGDSGGPLVCGKIVIGVISFGSPCGTPHGCATYTKIESYLDFIRSGMSNETVHPTSDNANIKNRTLWRLFALLYFLLHY